MHRKTWWVICLLLITTAVISAGLAVRNRHQAVKQPPRAPETTQYSRQPVTVKQKNRFIRRISAPAVANFQRNRIILPSVVVAQAILESHYGLSTLYRAAKNPFGIKGSYHGKSMAFYTHEVINGKPIRVLANFRKYPNLKAAINDHNQLLHRKFVKQKNMLSYRKATRLLQQNGYATDPHYAAKLNRLIIKYNLGRYDLKALNNN